MKKSNLDKWFEVDIGSRAHIVEDIEDLRDECIDYLQRYRNMRADIRAEQEQLVEGYERLLDLIKSDAKFPRDANELTLKVV